MNILSIIEIYDLGAEFHEIRQFHETLIFLNGKDSFGVPSRFAGTIKLALAANKPARYFIRTRVLIKTN